MRRWCETAGMVEDTYECGHCGKCAGVNNGSESGTRKEAVQHMPKTNETNRYYTHNPIQNTSPHRT